MLRYNMRDKTYWLFLVLGVALICASRIVGAVGPDIEKLWTGGRRWAWHLYQANDILLLGGNLVGFGFILLCVWLAVTFRSRL